MMTGRRTVRNGEVLERLGQLAAKQDDTFKLIGSIDKAVTALTERHNAFGTELQRATQDIAATDARQVKYHDENNRELAKLRDAGDERYARHNSKLNYWS